MCNLGSSLLYVGIHVRYITHTNIGWIYNGQSLCIPWILFGIIMDPSHTSCSKLAYCWYIFIIQGSKLSTKAVVHIKVGYYWLDNQSDWMVQLGDMMMGPPNASTVAAALADSHSPGPLRCIMPTAIWLGETWTNSSWWMVWRLVPESKVTTVQSCKCKCWSHHIGFMFGFANALSKTCNINIYI